MLDWKLENALLASVSNFCTVIFWKLRCANQFPARRKRNLHPFPKENKKCKKRLPEAVSPFDGRRASSPRRISRPNLAQHLIKQRLALHSPRGRDSLLADRRLYFAMLRGRSPVVNAAQHAMYVTHLEIEARGPESPETPSSFATPTLLRCFEVGVVTPEGVAPPRRATVPTVPSPDPVNWPAPALFSFFLARGGVFMRWRASLLSSAQA